MISSFYACMQLYMVVTSFYVVLSVPLAAARSRCSCGLDGLVVRHASFDWWCVCVCVLFPSRSFPAFLWLLQSSSLGWLLLDSPPKNMAVRALFLLPVFRVRDVGKGKSHNHRAGRLSSSSSLCSLPYNFVFTLLQPAPALVLFYVFGYFLP